MLKVDVTDLKQVNMDRNSSKGNQLKWFDGKTWYKADYLGYEALAEFVTSKLLKKTTVPEYVDYKMALLAFKGKQYTGCISEHFLKDEYELITLEKLFRRYKNVELTTAYADMNVEERIKYVVDEVKKITGLTAFGQYLTLLLELDALFLNEDRHMNNIAVIAKPDETFDYCPIFDNGAGMFSDIEIAYGLEKDLEKCFDEIEAKPFNRSFDEQVDAAEAMYGCPFKYWFTIQDVIECLEEVKEYYPAEIISRVEDVMRWQIHKYRYLQINAPQ